ncbi:anthranilate synthase [Ceratobasidium sp. AG-Ba]|nr:anthranilate synthase [Ceratobasidium sp. AG-Ba]
MSEEGDALLRNFLDLQGGTWAENPVSKVLDPTLHPFNADAPHRAPTILDKIYAQRLKDVELAKSTPELPKRTFKPSVYAARPTSHILRRETQGTLLLHLWPKSNALLRPRERLLYIPMPRSKL